MEAGEHHNCAYREDSITLENQLEYSNASKKHIVPYIAGNIHGELNLADWRFWNKMPN